MAEAPELFQVDDAGNVTVLQENPSLDFAGKSTTSRKILPN